MNGTCPLGRMGFGQQVPLGGDVRDQVADRVERDAYSLSVMFVQRSQAIDAAQHRERLSNHEATSSRGRQHVIQAERPLRTEDVQLRSRELKRFETSHEFVQRRYENTRWRSGDCERPLEKIQSDLRVFLERADSVEHLIRVYTVALGALKIFSAFAINANLPSNVGTHEQRERPRNGRQCFEPCRRQKREPSELVALHGAPFPAERHFYTSPALP